MKRVINLEEKIGKTVGRRRAPNPLQTQAGDIADAKAWSRAFPAMRGVRPGVYKFHSFAEADAWTMKYVTRTSQS